MGNRYFIIGNPSSVWMREYIKEIHIKNSDKVSITVFDESTLRYKEDYDKLGVDLVIVGKNSNALSKIEKSINLLKFAWKHHKNNRFDLIEIHYPPHNFQAYIIALLLKLMKTKSFLMFWGSDILPITSTDALKLEKIVSSINKINKLSEHTYEVFESHYGKRFDNLFTKKPLRFGTLALPYINTLLNNRSKKACKREFGIESDKVSIAIGYNGRDRQQHLNVIKEFYKFEKKITDKLCLILHMVELENQEYKEAVIKELELLEIEYILIDSTLSFEQISLMRIATDIFIHSQTTDGLSGSIRECLCSETVLLNPSWIRYDELEKIGLEYIQYDDFGEICDIIKKIIDKELVINTQRNKMLINYNYSWDSVYTNWVETFDEIIKE